MSDKSKQLAAWALSQVGCAYLYGCTGSLCTPAQRRARIAQYPAYRKAITAACPVLSIRQSSCAGCPCQDRPAYDCAQLTRRGAEHVGLALCSGSNSQYRTQKYWQEQGKIALMPRDKVCMVYKYTASNSTYSHTGVYLGDGTVVDARSHDAGVVRMPLEAYKGPWSHYAIPRGLYDAPAAPMPSLMTLRGKLCDALSCLDALLTS